MKENGRKEVRRGDGIRERKGEGRKSKEGEENLRKEGYGEN